MVFRQQAINRTEELSINLSILPKYYRKLFKEDRVQKKNGQRTSQEQLNVKIYALYL